MKITYGIANNNIDITSICYNLIYNNIIIIPSGDTNRDRLYTDPINGVRKKIYITIENNIIEYDDIITIKIDIINKTIVTLNNKLYLNIYYYNYKKLDIFFELYKLQTNLSYDTKKKYISSMPLLEFRFFCFYYLDYICKLPLKDFSTNSRYETVLIEYRILPHIEFIIRNTINKLHSIWCHTIICGNLNYDFMLEICNKINPKIKIIKTNFDNLSRNEYSNYLCTVDFWNLLTGEKILIYQEDSCIFKNNIDDFVMFDYIGAPWNSISSSNNICVGNGGFSLRTKKIMIDIINKISIEQTSINESS